MLETKKFQRTKEDFICQNCGQMVVGSGYTNHCPACLWSKHVDINPGDRLALCQGLMKPIDVEIRGQGYYVVHCCQVCGWRKKNKVGPHDDFEQVIKLSSQKI